MKRAQADGIFHRLGELLTRNFGLKILSLALAILIYEVLKPKADDDALTPRTAEEEAEPAADQHVTTNEQVSPREHAHTTPQ